ncbi:hypothetical protein, partial [uncultured Treponema sp.]|uniref:hypothetical protein n=1 Tax=uncultured Treponema sp. TaxID=162155 RepID=UPI00280A70D4
FLNDDLQSEKVPEQLRKILADENERKKLVIYINPPYAEVSTVIGKGKAGVNQSLVHDKYAEILGTAGRELYAQFFARIYFEIKGCILAEFSKLKLIQGTAFSDFLHHFTPKLISLFLVPANTFDNVKGDFPIGFFIWDSKVAEKFNRIKAHCFNENGILLHQKEIFVTSKDDIINKWISKSKISQDGGIGFLAGTNGNDFQHNNIVYILNKKSQMPNPRGIWVNEKNLIVSSIYLSVRHCIDSTWLNDRDQFLYPNDGWKTDLEFQSDCLAYTLLHGQNRISAAHGTNHWIPFTESEVNAKQAFESTFMTDFMKGRLKKQETGELDLAKTESTVYDGTQKIAFSEEAKAVLEAGKELYKYYYSKPHITKEANNASFYDIRASFQGIGSSGKMNNSSTDEKYNALIADLRTKQKILAKKIEPKVYEYGFLK